MSFRHSDDLSLCDVRRVKLRHTPRRSAVQLLLREGSIAAIWRALASGHLVAIAPAASKSGDHSEFTAYSHVL